MRISNRLSLKGFLSNSPLISKDSFNSKAKTLESLRAKDVSVIGGERLDIEDSDEYYVKPALVLVKEIEDEMLSETFAPILYVKSYEKIEDAIRMQNEDKDLVVQFLQMMRNQNYFK